MDDEEAIRDLFRQFFQVLGYEVHAVAEGTQAIDLFGRMHRQNEGFDFVFLDLSVPNGMGGVEALELIRQMDSHAKVIALTGSLREATDVASFDATITKPFRFDAVRKLIEQMAAAA
jgi:CheY-like chemotaxis protein